MSGREFKAREIGLSASELRAYVAEVSDEAEVVVEDTTTPAA
jgi:hypothetical protein